METVRRLLKISYQDHPPKCDVTSGLNYAEQLVSQSENMAFRLAKIFLYLQTIKFVSFRTGDRKMLQAHFFDFLSLEALLYPNLFNYFLLSYGKTVNIRHE